MSSCLCYVHPTVAAKMVRGSGDGVPSGSRGKAPVEGQGSKPPEAEHFFTNYK